MRVLIRFPLDTLHTSIVFHLDPDAKYSPFGENTTLVIDDKQPARILIRFLLVLIRFPLDTLQTFIVLSIHIDIKYSPFGENTTFKADEWPLSLNREHIDQLSLLDIYNPSFYS